MEPQAIGNIGNYYGGLVVTEQDGKFFWSITNWDGDGWDEIPKSLYDTLVEYEKTRIAQLGAARDAFSAAGAA